ncbi:MAG TPA: VOC family protein [Candidatus Saccharimonadales bacterium]|nr:VOC family protein [Candidatus Saccharimonadales bacterium]
MPRVIHFEIPAESPDRIQGFYSGVFGWKFTKWEGPVDYWLITTGKEGQPGIDGGMGRKQAPMGPCNTIDVPSLDEFVAKVERAGGAIVAPKMAIPGVGWLAYARDPEGNTFGMMQADAAAK